MSRLVTLGESIGVVRSTAHGGFALLGDAQVGVGGAESNSAIAARRLGVAACWVSRVGDDAIGRRVVRELRAEGVDVRAAVDPMAPTGILLKDTPRSGVTEVQYYRAGSAASRLDTHDIDRAELVADDVLHLTGITPALSVSAQRAVFGALAAARAVGARVAFDVNHRSRLWSSDHARPIYRRLVAAADLVFAGDDEVALVLGTDATDGPEALARGLSALGPSEVVMKLGDRGAGSLVAGVWSARPAVPVAVADTVGAGDAFAGAYLAGLMQGRDAAARLELAIRNGAAACTHPGDWEGAATHTELATWAAHDVIR
ncbi:sugar kinase [Agromyces aerolatus]|uniref:sugar kinase n=1 Tax=Agromyces sp. LY-1074 TaxID=3074080 RepID=UPI00285C20AD|nr:MULTISPECIES: sugar kinase [unclassified Agromyces]MDR5701209.1 sugar kinase [Agromyces sp. LY-1074]MDR5706915.1 sugar kinase [Agromyces sp. LY-1358]